MILRIIAKDKSTESVPFPDGEISWDSPISKAMEETISFRGTELSSFMLDWNRFIFQTNIAASPEFIEKFSIKSKNLYSILFGNSLPPWQEIEVTLVLSFRTDAEYTNLPLEILPYRAGSLLERENLTRSIRGSQNPDHSNGKTGKKFLFLKNPVLKNLFESTEREADLIETIYFKYFKKDFTLLVDFRLAKFWEEMSQARFVHYAGHTQSEGIPFEKENFYLLNQISEKSLHGVQVLFLNSCDGASENQSIPSLVRCFLQAGVQNVLGFLNPVPTEHAEIAATTFWNDFLLSKDLFRSHHLAKLSLLKLGAAGKISALSLVCFASEAKKDFSKFPKAMVQFLAFSAVLLFLLSFLIQQESSKEADSISPETVEEAYQTYLKKAKPIALVNQLDYSTQKQSFSMDSSLANEQEKDFQFYISKCQRNADSLQLLFFFNRVKSLYYLQNCMANPKLKLDREIQSEIEIYSKLGELYVPRNWMENPDLKDKAVHAQKVWREFLIRFSNLSQKQEAEYLESSLEITEDLREIFLLDAPDHRKLDALKKWELDLEAEKRALFYFSAISPSNPWGQKSLAEENQKTKEYYLEVLNFLESSIPVQNQLNQKTMDLKTCISNFPTDSDAKYRLLFWYGFFKDYDFRPKEMIAQTKTIDGLKSLFFQPLFKERLFQVTYECENLQN